MNSTIEIDRIREREKENENLMVSILLLLFFLFLLEKLQWTPLFLHASLSIKIYD